MKYKKETGLPVFIADDPLARQFTVENALEKVKAMAGRSTAGRPGQRGGVKRKKR